MDWPKADSVHWQSYTTTPRGYHRPLIHAVPNFRGKSFAPRPFILDTGAVLSVAPKSYAADLIDLNEYILQPTGAMDVHGRALQGVPILLELELQSTAKKIIRFQETLWFCSGLNHGLLGQRSCLEQIGGIFCNFPDRRQFGIFEPPGCFEALSFHTPGAWRQGGDRTFEFTDSVEEDIVEAVDGPALYSRHFEVSADFQLQVDWFAPEAELRSSLLLRFFEDPSSSRVGEEDLGTEIPLQGRSCRAGEWNTFELEVRGTRLWVVCRGVEVFSASLPSRARGMGSLTLRNEPGSRIQFRAPRLRRIDGSRGP